MLRRSAFHLRVHIANETRSEEERKELTEYLHNQLDKLEKEAERVTQELQIDVKQRYPTRKLMLDNAIIALLYSWPVTFKCM